MAVIVAARVLLARRVPRAALAVAFAAALFALSPVVVEWRFHPAGTPILKD